VKYKVSLTQAALNDLYAINDYYLAQVSDTVATNIISKLQSAVLSLENLPERGSIPRELSVTGIMRYRQIVTLNYRIIYRSVNNMVYVMMVIDGRRDVVTALMRRQLV